MATWLCHSDITALKMDVLQWPIPQVSATLQTLDLLNKNDVCVSPPGTCSVWGLCQPIVSCPWESIISSQSCRVLVCNDDGKCNWLGLVQLCHRMATLWSKAPSVSVWTNQKCVRSIALMSFLKLRFIRRVRFSAEGQPPKSKIAIQS